MEHEDVPDGTRTPPTPPARSPPPTSPPPSRIPAVAHLARVPGTDAGCGLSIRGLWAGLAICNERQRVRKHTATRSTYYYINYGYYNTYFIWIEIIKNK